VVWASRAKGGRRGGVKREEEGRWVDEAEIAETGKREEEIRKINRLLCARFKVSFKGAKEGKTGEVME